MRKARILFSLALLANCLLTTPAFAQITYGADVAFKTGYVWRGLTYRDAPAFQPDVFLTYGKPRSVRLNAGVWTHFTAVDPIDGIGFGRLLLGEVDLWGEISFPFRQLDAAVGWIGYHFSVGEATEPLRSLADTHEVYGRLQLRALHVILPRLTAWYDLSAVKGAYVESDVSFRVPAWTKVLVPLGSIVLNACAGFSLGQQVNNHDLAENAYFDNRGLTYADLSATATLGYVGLGAWNIALNAEGHIQRNHDPRTKQISRNRGRDYTSWFGLTLTVLVPRCRPDRDICPPSI